MKPARTHLTFGILLFLFYMSCLKGHPGEIVLSGTIEADSVHAGSWVGGRVAEVMVKNGDTVEGGDILFRLETLVLEAERARAESLVAEAQAAYDVLAAGAKAEDIARARSEAEALRHAWELAQAGPLPEDIAAAESQAASLEAVYRNAEDAATRMASLFEQGVVSEREYIAARESADAAKNQWDAALMQIEALNSRPRPEEVAAAQARYYAALNAVRSLEAGATPEQLAQALARIETAMEAVSRIDVDLGEAIVTAPSNGMVSNFDLKPGDFVAPGQAGCELVDMVNLKLYVYIPENRLGFIHEGQELQLKVDTWPDRTFMGIVVNVASEAEFTPRNVQVVDERVSQVYRVELSVANSELLLRPGMAADVTVPIM